MTAAAAHGEGAWRPTTRAEWLVDRLLVLLHVGAMEAECDALEGRLGLVIADDLVTIRRRLARVRVALSRELGSAPPVPRGPVH